MKTDMTLQSIDRGIAVDSSSRDRAISHRVMKGIPMPEDRPDRILVPGDENDNPSSWSRAHRAVSRAKAGRDMAIHI